MNNRSSAHRTARRLRGRCPGRHEIQTTSRAERVTRRPGRFLAGPHAGELGSTVDERRNRTVVDVARGAGHALVARDAGFGRLVRKHSSGESLRFRPTGFRRNSVTKSAAEFCHRKPGGAGRDGLLFCGRNTAVWGKYPERGVTEFATGRSPRERSGARSPGPPGRVGLEAWGWSRSRPAAGLSRGYIRG